MRRWLLAAVLLVVVATVAAAWALTLGLEGPDSPRAGVNTAATCDLGNVYFHPTSSAGGADHWTYWRIETSAFDAVECAGQELRSKTAWDGPDEGTEPDGYFYMRIPVNEDLNKPTVVGRTILGVFGDAVLDICDPENCYEKDAEGHYVIRYIYSSYAYDEASKIMPVQSVADHTLGDTRWIVTAVDSPFVDF